MFYLIEMKSFSNDESLIVSNLIIIQIFLVLINSKLPMKIKQLSL